MNLDELLGIDPNEALTRRARRLLEADRRLIAELRARRQALELSQHEVARRMDTSQSVVARIEAGGRDMHQSTIRRYAMAVGVTIEHVVTPDDEALERSARMLSDLRPQLERLHRGLWGTYNPSQMHLRPDVNFDTIWAHARLSGQRA